MSTMRLASIVVAALLLLPASALASQARIFEGTALSVDGEDSEVNDFTVAYDTSQNVFHVTDRKGITVTPVAPCTATDRANAVDCPPDGVSYLDIRPGADDDTVRIQGTSLPATVLAGAGNDVVDGGPGTDRIDGGDGNDTIDGGGGHDTLVGGLGADVIHGGAGQDSVVYRDGEHDAGVHVTLGNSLSGDGVPGEGDDIAGDVEAVGGSDGPDFLSGTSANEQLMGGGGNDVIQGGAGDDRLLGEDGEDRLAPTSGADFLDGGPGTCD